MSNHQTAALFLDFLRERTQAAGYEPPPPSAELDAALMSVAGHAGDADALVASIEALLDFVRAPVAEDVVGSLERLLHTALGPQWTPSIADRVRRAGQYAVQRRAGPPAPRASAANRVRPGRRVTGAPRPRSTPRSAASTAPPKAAASPPQSLGARRSRRAAAKASPTDPAKAGPTFEVAVDRSTRGSFKHMPMEELIVALWRSWWSGTVYFAQDNAALEDGGDFAVSFREGIPVAIGANVEATAKGLIRAFGWREGSFRRDADVPPPAGADEVMSPMALLVAGVVRGVPLGEVAQSMADCGVKHVARTNLADGERGCAVLAQQCDGVITMRELVSSSADSAKALYALYCAAVAHIVSFQEEVTSGIVQVSYVNVRPQGSESGPAPGVDRRKAHASVVEIEQAYGLLDLKAGCGPGQVSSAFMRAVGRGVSVEQRAKLASALDTVMSAEKEAAKARASAETRRSVGAAPPPPNTGALATASIARSSFNRGQASLQHGDAAKAVQYFGQAVEFEPECVEYRASYYLAAVRADSRRAMSTLVRVDEWLEQLHKEGTSCRSERSQVHLLAGRIHQVLGQNPEAQEHFLNAVAADRKNHQAANELRRAKLIHTPSARVKRALNRKVF